MAKVSPNLINLKNLVQRYSATDAILHDILQGVISEIQEIELGHYTDAGPTPWGPVIIIKNHLATDFAISGGGAWNVVGVAANITRHYTVSQLSGTNRFLMWYGFTIEASTITVAGNNLSIKIPPGYKPVETNIIRHGSGMVIVPAAGIQHEPINVRADNEINVINMVRNGAINFPAVANGVYVYGSITFPCMLQGGTLDSSAA